MNSLGIAVTFVWLGMVLAISFLEAPLKFRAPGVEVAVGLSIGRIVFRALNAIELAWAIVIVIVLVVDPPVIAAIVAAVVSIVLLLIQLGAVRPRLNQRSDRVLAGETLPRSKSHHAYVVLEVAKVAALLLLGAELFSG